MLSDLAGAFLTSGLAKGAALFRVDENASHRTVMVMMMVMTAAVIMT